MKRALEIYATGGRDAPAIRDKAALVEDIQRGLRETKAWMAERGVSVDAIVAAEGLAKSDLIGGARAKLTLPDDVRMRFLRMSSELWAAFKSALPDPLVGALFPEIDTVRKVDIAIREHLPKPKIGDLAAEMEDLLDRSVVGIEITRPLPDPDSMDGLVNLGAIDFERLRALFAKGRGQSAVQLARNEAETRAKNLAAQNPTRQSFLDRYQQLVADYNERRMTAEEIFAELMRLIEAMGEEDRRHARENLGEEELALFDVLTQPDPQLPEAKRDEVKDVARDLLTKLKSLFSGIDWQANPTMRAKVRTTIKGALRKLPDEYDDNLWEAKVAATVDWVFRRYGGAA
nr:type I restriction enzyme endonuclease domain-containing protein [Neoroseomonas nitratireducens]